jgi:chromosome segregation ATPase
MNDTDKVPSWTEQKSYSEHMYLDVRTICNRRPATLADLQKAAEACGYRLVTDELAETLQDRVRLLKDRDQALKDLEQVSRELYQQTKLKDAYRAQFDAKDAEYNKVKAELETMTLRHAQVNDMKKHAWDNLEKAETELAAVKADSADMIRRANEELQEIRNSVKIMAEERVSKIFVNEYYDAKPTLIGSANDIMSWYRARALKAEEELDMLTKDRDDWKARCEKAEKERDEYKLDNNLSLSNERYLCVEIDDKNAELFQVKQQLAKLDNELNCACVRAVAAEKVADEVQAELEQCKKELEEIRGAAEPWNLDRILKDRKDLAKFRSWCSKAKRVWVNLRPDGVLPTDFDYAHVSKSSAESCKARLERRRIAVPFVELSGDIEEVLNG